MTKTAQALAVLKDGPATAAEVAIELGWTTQYASACLHNAATLAHPMVRVRPFYQGASPAERTYVNLYELI